MLSSHCTVPIVTSTGREGAFSHVAPMACIAHTSDVWGSRESTDMVTELSKYLFLDLWCVTLGFPKLLFVCLFIYPHNVSNSHGVTVVIF